MDFFSSMRISASGMNAQQARMNTISSNMANAQTPEYKRRDPVFTATADRESFGEVLAGEMDESAQGVLVTEIQEDTRPPRMVYDAKTGTYVAMPNVNPVEEMANMMQAQRSYEANATALNAAAGMAMKALDIGK